MNNIYRKKNILIQRECHLKVLKYVLEMYQKTKDKYYLEYAKWLGGISKELSDELKTL